MVVMPGQVAPANPLKVETKKPGALRFRAFPL